MNRPRRPLFRARQRLGKYRIDKKLGEGGFAVVYRATDMIEGIPVALKVPHPSALTQDAIDSLRREVRLVKRLDHPHILPVKDASIIDDWFVLVTPLGEETLADRLRRRLSPAMALSFTEQLVSAVAHAHARRVMHLDIKPENVLVLSGGRVVLADFGVGRVALGTRSVRGGGTGTVGYVAPEQALGRPSPRSDVFSLSLVIYRMFAGKLPEWPFRWPPPGVDRLKRTLTPEFVALLARALDLDARGRFADGVELEAAFQRIRGRALRRPKKTSTKAPKAPRPRGPLLLVNSREETVQTVDFADGRAAVFSTAAPGYPNRKNEDVVGLWRGPTSRGVMFVADGAGGLPAGHKASQLAARELIRSLDDGRRRRAPPREALLDGFERANRAIVGLRSGAATTLSAVIVDGADVRPAHTGDSVLLVVGQRGRIRLQTLPHGPVGYAVRAGLLDDTEALDHDEAHLVTNLVGFRDMRIELGPPLPLATRDTAVLASDGLWDNLSVAEISEIIRGGQLEKVAARLAETALDAMRARETPDDLSFVVYRPG